MSALAFLRRVALVFAASVALIGLAFPQSDALVTTDWLEKNLDNPKVRIVEVSVEPGLWWPSTSGSLAFRLRKPLATLLNAAWISPGVGRSSRASGGA